MAGEMLPMQDQIRSVLVSLNDFFGAHSLLFITMSSPIRTEFFPSLIPADTATFAFEYLRDNIAWEEGVRSRKGFTRLAKAVNMDDDIVRPLAKAAIEGIASGKNKIDKLLITNIYLNYYKDGTYWTPNHTHPGTAQIIISLGAGRTLNVAKKSYRMSNGDVAIFGSSVHGVPKEGGEVGPRISIAIFAVRV